MSLSLVYRMSYTFLKCSFFFFLLFPEKKWKRENVGGAGLERTKILSRKWTKAPEKWFQYRQKKPKSGGLRNDEETRPRRGDEGSQESWRAICCRSNFFWAALITPLHSASTKTSVMIAAGWPLGSSEALLNINTWKKQFQHLVAVRSNW